jgi:DNA cross-link repair 1B protein
MGVVYATDAGGGYCVDWFAGGEGVSLYLLTHMHTDHLSGLFEARGRVHSKWARRTGPKIVCSAQTKALLVARGVPGCRVCELPLNQPCAVNVGGGSSGPTVTLFDANHCPGSVMFHVQWNDVNNLHTGDFRYKAEIHGSKHMIEQVKYVHKIFLDTTFCHKSWDSTKRHFPSQEESIQLLIGLIKQEIACGQRDIYIAADSYGQEDILRALKHTFDSRILLDTSDPNLPLETSKVEQLCHVACWY